MAASAADKFRKTYSFLQKTISDSGGIDDNDTTLTPNNMTDIPTDTGVSFIVDRVDSNGNLTPTKRELMTGRVNGSTITDLVRGEHGTTAQAHANGAVIEFVNSGKLWNDLVDGLSVSLNQDGTIKNNAITTAAQITNDIIGNDEMATAVKPITLLDETTFDFVASGGVWSGDSYGSTRAASMTAMICYINGRRISISAVTARTFTASKDTYVDVLDNADGTGTLVYTEVTNNAASPALASDSIRIAIIVTGASSIANVGSVNQGEETKVLPIASSVAYAVTDSLGNLICNRDPLCRTLGYRQVTNSQTGVTAEADATGLSLTFKLPVARKVKITFDANYDASNVDSSVFACIKESTTYLNGRGGQTGTGASGYRQTVVTYYGTMTAGSHTVKAAFQRYAGTGTISLGASAAAANTPGPAYLKVELQ